MKHLFSLLLFVVALCVTAFASTNPLVSQLKARAIYFQSIADTYTGEDDLSIAYSIYFTERAEQASYDAEVARLNPLGQLLTGFYDSERLRNDLLSVVSYRIFADLLLGNIDATTFFRIFVHYTACADQAAEAEALSKNAPSDK